MTREELHKAIGEKLMRPGGYDFVVVDDFDEDGEYIEDSGVPVCDRYPLDHLIPGDKRWAWYARDTLILFDSKEDEEAAENFVANIKKLRA